jgi:hypothetical protein
MALRCIKVELSNCEPSAFPIAFLTFFKNWTHKERKNFSCLVHFPRALTEVFFFFFDKVINTNVPPSGKEKMKQQLELFILSALIKQNVDLSQISL